MERVKLIPTAARAAATRKRSVAQELDEILNSHLNDVNNYSDFWDGLTFDRFLNRYRERDHGFRDMTRSLRSQADELDRIAREKEEADSRMERALS